MGFFLQFMGWESKVGNQMLSSCLCLLKNNTPLSSWMALVPLLLLLFSSYLLLGFGVFSILYTSLALALSTVLYVTVLKQKTVQVDKLVEGQVLSCEEEEISSDQRDKNVRPLTPSHSNETLTEAKEDAQQQADHVDVVANYSTTWPDLLSESTDCQDQLSTSEDSEADWRFPYEYDHSPSPEFECSDGSISDEDSLIEIALPSGHYMGHPKELEPKYNCSSQQQQQQKKKKKKRELSVEAPFTQHNLMEFIAEFNDMSEEENLIEIDISMGSIKYSRFEIQA